MAIANLDTLPTSRNPQSASVGLRRRAMAPGLARRAEAQTSVQSYAKATSTVSPDHRSGAVAAEAGFKAQASTSQQFASHAAMLQAKAPGLARRAHLSTTGLEGGFQASASVQAQGKAYAQGTLEPNGLSGAVGFNATASAEVQASGHAEVGTLVQASAAGKAKAEAGSSADARGHLRVGIDSLGLPSIEATAGAEAMAGVRASGDAHGHLSLLELVEIDVGGSAQAIAGAAAAIAAGFGFKDGKVWVKSGATAAAGAGASGTADVGVGLGKIPRGVLQTTLAPVLAVPTLAVSTLYKGVASIFGETPDVPDLTDLPKTVATAVSAGAKNVADGVVGIGKQIGDVAEGIGKFFGKLF